MLRFAPSTVNVTPPIGHALCGGLVKPAIGVRDPIYARGVILDDGKMRVVLCAVEFCAIDNTAHRQASLALARGARTSVRRVALHSVHQHDVPYIQLDAEPMLKKHGIGQLDEDWWARVVGNLQRAAATAAKALRPVTHVGVGEARVSGCASNRRLVGPDGKVQAMRFSMCTDPKLQAWPVGLIDPLLRTITLWNGKRLLSSLSYYATHPQSAYGRGLISADAIGEALRLTRRGFPNAHHIYFTGCGANITFGKYATKNLEGNIRLFGGRIADGIARAIRSSESSRVEPGPLQWRAFDVRLPFRPRFSLSHAKKRLASKAEPLGHRVLGAWGVASMARAKQVAKVCVQSLRLGPAWVVHLPSEVFVEYQLFAQSLRPEEFVAVAAYGDGKLLYLPTAEAFAQGGYEPSEYACYTTPAVEPVLKKAIASLLA
jgi:hypothetical protein